MPFDAAAKEAMLDHFASLVATISIHTADPGSGADNEVTGGGYSRQAASFAAAAGGTIALAADVEFSGPAAEDALWFAVWDGSSQRLAKGQISSGDQAFNAEGEFVLTTSSIATITDPA